ncbi:butyrophilin subfamily 1 member A1-like [Chiroxiphia lanceolata]|uniref:butyrophilin subfamily 1 member A1-like n=1 Tax=Chiroxiphia lanceolata TaxID=296741 RepID=UPI0013CF0248|nr:butyrophilin subfamily 1 member A1-like [Chiroxiphia lanceolata]
MLSHQILHSMEIQQAWTFPREGFPPTELLSWDQGTPPRCQVTAKQLLLQPRVQERAQGLQVVLQGGGCSAVPPIHCSLLAFVISTLVFQVPQGHSAPLTVTAPPGPITVAKGEDVVLPCSFSPGQNAQDTEVTWFREQFSPFVHRYKWGQDQYREQMVQYQGRTELGKDGLAKGSADLRIFHVQPSDTGNYTCFVQRGSDYDEAVVELKVTASGSAPLIALERYEHGGIRVACRSAGWYPRPRVLWHDPHGRHLPSLSENATQDKNGLFAAESSIILTRAGNQELSCSVQHLPHTPGQGSALHISDPFFQDAHPWMIALGVVLVAVVTLLIITVYLFKIKGTILGLGAGEGAGQPSYSATSSPEGKQQKEIGKQQKEIEQQAQELANVVLDPDTAHCELVLSDNGKSVTRVQTRQGIPNNPKRFNVCHCVLGRKGFTSGRHYWEMEVENAGEWVVGVSREDVRRKGYIEFKPEEGIWAVGNWGGHFQALTSVSHTPLPKIQNPKWIRVSVDYEMGQVAFFSVDEGIPIFVFTQASFGGKKVYPWFWLGPGICLKICPDEEEAEREGSPRVEISLPLCTSVPCCISPRSFSEARYAVLVPLQISGRGHGQDFA